MRISDEQFNEIGKKFADEAILRLEKQQRVFSQEDSESPVDPLISEKMLSGLYMQLMDTWLLSRVVVD